MSQSSNRESGWLLGRGALLGASAAIALCLALISLYSVGVLRLELVLILSIVPFLLWLFFDRQEILLLVVIAAYFAASYFSNSLVAGGLIRSLFLFIILLALLLKLGVKKVIRRISTPLDKIILIWSVIILFSLIYGFFFKGNESRYLIGDLYKFVEIFLVFWLATFLIKNDKQARSLIWGFFIVALIFGVIDSIGFLARFLLLGSALLARVRAAAQFSSLFALILAISLILHERKTVIKIILAILGFGFLFSFLLTFLRTGYIAIPPTLIFILFLYLYKNRGHALGGMMRFAVFVLCLLILVVSVDLVFTATGFNIEIIEASFVRLSSLINPASSEPMGVRMLELESIVSQVLAPSPLLGNGLGGEYYSATLVDEEIQWGIKHYVHNNYFDFIVRTGMLGLIVFIVLAIKYLKDAIKFYLRSKNSFYQGVLLGSIGIFISSSIIALSTSILYSPFLFIIMAVTYCVASIEERKGKEVEKSLDGEPGVVDV